MVYVYYCDIKSLNNEETYSYYYSRLSSERKRKVNEYTQLKDKKSCVGVGALIDFGLKRYKKKEKNMEYGITQMGKPYFKGIKNVFFSVSHSGEKAVVAFSDVEIGCDIEEVREKNLKIANRFFTENENFLLKNAKSEREKLETFFRIWTIKESFVKMTGEGLCFPLNSFDVVFGKNKGFTAVLTNDGKKYSVKELEILDNYKLSVCTERETEFYIEEINIEKAMYTA